MTRLLNWSVISRFPGVLNGPPDKADEAASKSRRTGGGREPSWTRSSSRRSPSCRAATAATDQDDHHDGRYDDPRPDSSSKPPVLSSIGVTRPPEICHTTIDIVSPASIYKRYYRGSRAAGEANDLFDQRPRDRGPGGGRPQDPEAARQRLRGRDDGGAEAGQGASPTPP